MAAMLKGSAVTAVNKGPPSAFYSSVDKPNPVLQALDQEIKLYVAFMKKRAQPGYKKTGDEACSRPYVAMSITLCVFFVLTIYCQVSYIKPVLSNELINEDLVIGPYGYGSV